MSKGLEALKYLDEHNLNWHDNPTKKYVDIIEKELKTLMIIKEMLNSDIGYKLNANSRKILKEIFESLSKEKQDLLIEELL